MKLLIPLSIFSAVAVASAYVPAYGIGMPYMPPMGPYAPRYSSGSSYLGRDYSRGTGAAHGGGFRNQGSNSFYDQGEHHHRTKQVIESEDSSRHNVGGGRQGSSSGGSFGRSNSYGHGGLNTGRRYTNYGPGIYK